MIIKKHKIEVSDIISFCALIISTLGFFFTLDQHRNNDRLEERAYQLNEKVQQLDSQFKKYSVKPLLQFDYNENDDGKHLYLENSGTGSAIITEIHSYYNDQEFTNWPELGDLVQKSDPYFDNGGYPTILPTAPFFIAANQKKEIISLTFGDAEIVSSVIESISVKITYTDVYSDTFHITYQGF